MENRPNIVLITTDQEQHWELLPDNLGLRAHQRLLAAGVGFRNYHVVTLPCGPSRSVMYTGQHTCFTGVLQNPNSRGNNLSTEIRTIGRMLRDAGYVTAFKGKWHVSTIDAAVPFVGSTADALEPYGFSDFNANRDPVGITWDGYREDPSIASDAAAWIAGFRGRKPLDRPWFLAVNFVNPHDVMFFDVLGRDRKGSQGTFSSRTMPAPSDPLYAKAWDVELPASLVLEDPSTKPASQTIGERYLQLSLGTIARDDESAWRTFRSYYFNCLIDVDRHVDTVLTALTDAGHDRDTVVIYTTDHGEAGGAHGLREKPTSMYREVTRVPLIVVHPDGESGVTTDAMASAIDLTPTILGLAGVDARSVAEDEPDLKGNDLSSVIVDPDGEGPRDGVLLYMSSMNKWDLDFSIAQGRIARDEARPGDAKVVAEGPRLESRVLMRAIVEPRFKFARYFAPAHHHRPVTAEQLFEKNDLELYDTNTDPDELHNLAHDPNHRERVEVLNGRLNTLIDHEVGRDDGHEFGGDLTRFS